MDPKRGVSECIIRALIVVVCIALSLQTCCALPVDASNNDRTKRSAASVRSSGEYALTRRDMKTWTLIRDLEEAVFNLKEHLLSVDAGSHSSRTDQTDTDTDVVDTLPEPNEHSDRHMEESYPEFTAELEDKKAVHVGRSRGQNTQKSDDMSLKEALEFLVNLAKEKKKEELRDHDTQLSLASRQ